MLERGEGIDTTSPLNRHSFKSETPCKRFDMSTQGSLYHSEEQMHSFQGPKMQNGVCCVHCITCVPHDPSLPSWHSVYFSKCVFQMGGAHPKLNQAAGKGNDPKWGEFVGDTAPWNRFPWGFVTPCKKYYICPSGRLYHSEEHMHSIEGAKMGHGVCNVCPFTRMPHDPSSHSNTWPFQLMCSRRSPRQVWSAGIKLITLSETWFVTF